MEKVYGKRLGFRLFGGVFVIRVVLGFYAADLDSFYEWISVIYLSCI